MKPEQGEASPPLVIYGLLLELHPRARMLVEEPSTWHVKGNLFLTGNEWSSECVNDDRGHPSGYARYFDFNEGRSNEDDLPVHCCAGRPVFKLSRTSREFLGTLRKHVQGYARWYSG